MPDRRRVSQHALRWPLPTFEVTVEEVLVEHTKEDLRQWSEAKKAWIDQGMCAHCREKWAAGCRQCDYSVWGPYSDLVASRRYHYAHYDRKDRVGWPEGFTALKLADQGFTCWTGVHLFPTRRDLTPAGRASTAAIEERLKRAGMVLPRDAYNHLQSADGRPLKPGNPDIVAYDEVRDEWRFAEVKWKGDTTKDDQIIGLALLHLLTGANVAVIHLIPKGSTVAPQSHQARFRYAGPLTVARVE